MYVCISICFLLGPCPARPPFVGELGKCCSYQYHQSSDCNMSCSVSLLERSFRKSSSHFVVHREHVEPTLREPAREKLSRLHSLLLSRGFAVSRSAGLAHAVSRGSNTCKPAAGSWSCCTLTCSFSRASLSDFETEPNDQVQDWGPALVLVFEARSRITCLYRVDRDMTVARAW